MKPPAFQFYVDDFIAGTMNFTDCELGLYMRLLCVQWSVGGISNSDYEISKYGRGRTPIDRVKTKFKLCDDGMLRNQRLEQEREKQAEWRRKSSLGGKHSGLARLKGGSRVVEPPPQPKGNTPVSGLRSPVSINTLGGRRPAPTGISVETLKANPAYAGINVDQEYGKAVAWCAANKRQLTPRRFVNWLNRVERPIETRAARPTKPITPECPGWDKVLNTVFSHSIYSSGGQLECATWIQVPEDLKTAIWKYHHEAK